MNFSHRRENSIQLQSTNKSVQEDTGNPNSSSASEGRVKEEIQTAHGEIHTKSTNAPIQTLVRCLFRAPVSGKPITWKRMKFALWARYYKRSLHPGIKADVGISDRRRQQRSGAGGLAACLGVTARGQR